MNWLDILLLVLLAVPTIGGLFRGLVKSALALVGIILGVFLAGQFYDTVGGWLGFISSTDAANVVGFLIVFLVTIIVANLLGNLLKNVLSMTLLGWVDRLGGAVFGFLLGAVFLSAILATWAKFFGSDAITESFIASALLDKFPLIMGLLPEEFDAVRDFFN